MEEYYAKNLEAKRTRTLKPVRNGFKASEENSDPASFLVKNRNGTGATNGNIQRGHTQQLERPRSQVLDADADADSVESDDSISMIPT
jgi:hypothetical protein